MATNPDPSRKPKVRVKAVGRPFNVEGEQLALGGQMLASRLDARNGGVYFLPIDEIIIRKGWRTYQDMRHDDQVKAVLAFKKVLVGGRSWDIVPAKDGDAKAEEIAKFVAANLARFNFKRCIKQALSAFDFGFSLGEIVWELDMWEGNRAIMIKDVKHRDPQSIEINADNHGNVLGFRQLIANGLIEVDAKKCWHWAHQSEFGNPYGISDLRAAYRSWWAKKFIVNFWNVFLERMGSPMTMMKYPQGASEALKETLKRILSGLSSRTEILVPEGVTVELIEATRSGTATYKEALQFHDVAIARALLMIGILGLSAESTGRGADSQSRLQLRILFKMADELAQDLIRTFHDQVLKQLVDMNFEHDNQYPQFVWQDYGAFEGVEIADTIRQLHAAGVVDMDQADVNYVRSILGLPLRDEDDKPDEVLRPTPTPLTGEGAGAPPAAGSGNERAAKGKGERKTDPESGRSKGA